MKSNQRSKYGITLTVLCIIAFNSFAQKNFKYQATLSKIDSSGFYRINLMPDFIAKSAFDLTDVRLVDEKGAFVPYINATGIAQTDKLKFEAFTQVSDNLLADTGTTFIIKADAKKPLSGLSVRLKNTDVVRSVNISGSDDLKHWYAIQENVPLSNKFLNNDGTYYQQFSFPTVSYQYFKLLVNDRYKTPIKFLQAGAYTDLPIENAYIAIPHLPLITKDSANHTNITISFIDKYRVDRFKFKIRSPKFYKRRISVFSFDKGNRRKLIDSGEINSNTQALIVLTIKTGKLQLQIDNGDNPPLYIEDIETMEKRQSVIAYLDKEKTYKLLTGNEKASTQKYDLNFFLDSIHGDPVMIQAGAIEINPSYSESAEAVVKHERKLYIWLAIIIALGLLSFLTVKMVKDINAKPN